MEHFTCSPSSMTTFPANFFIPHTNKKTFFYVKASKKQSKKKLSRILTTEAAVQGIERRALSANSTHLWPKSVLEALTGAITNNQWESALKIFELLRKQDWYVPRCQTYTKLFVMLGKCKQPGYASLLYEKMVAEGLKPSVDVYTSLVSVYGLSGHFQEAFGIVDDMKSVTDCKPDIYTYSILINCCSKFRRFDLIERVLEDMSYLGIECSIVTYNTLIDGYGKAEMFERMEKLLDDMTKNNKCLPDVYTMNSFLWAYGNVGEIKEMERWYEKFQLMEVQSDIKTFNILIRSYGKARMHDKMEKVIDFMKKRFCSPTTVTFNILIEMFGRVGNIVKMEYYFRMMKYKGVKPNSVTYCSLVNFYSKAEELNKISLILRQVENSDVVLDTPFFNCVISAYGQVGELQRMEEMFVEMKRRKCMPDNITFATMIQAYTAQGMTESAQQLETSLLNRKENSGGAMTQALKSRNIVEGLLKSWSFPSESKSLKFSPLSENSKNDLRLLDTSGSGHEVDSIAVTRSGTELSPTAVLVRVSHDKEDVIQNSNDLDAKLQVQNSVTAGIVDPTIKQWVHMVCGLWTPGTRCPNVDTMSAFDVSGVSHPPKNLVCSLCNRPGGSCIECRVVNCSVHFHPWCARQKGLLQSEVEGVDNDKVGFYGRCVLHATHHTSDSVDHPMDINFDTPGREEFTCARTEGYKGRKKDGFSHNLQERSNGNGECLVPQEQIDAWLHINGHKSCTVSVVKTQTSEVEYDYRKEYARYKQAKGWKNLVVYKSGVHALGLYTSQFISRGAMVVEYIGEIVGLRVADKREIEYQSGRKLQYKGACYFFRIDKEHIIDATHKGGIARFVNHSCLPNSVAKVISVRNEKKVVFFAERDIFPGEEITYDYHFNHEDEGDKIPCLCNSRKGKMIELRFK